MNDELKGAAGAIIVAAGKGSRLNLGYNKVLAPLGGIPVLKRTADAFAVSRMVQEIVVVIQPEDELHIREMLKESQLVPIRYAHGGADRQESVWNGLLALSKEIDVVLIHDGARPFINRDLIRRSIEAAGNFGAACAGMPVKDTIKRLDPEGFILETPARNTLWSAQTPQAFRTEIIMEAHRQAIAEAVRATDDAALAEACGYKVRMFEGSYENIKITSREDLLFAEALAPLFNESLNL